ncbi:MAG: hypothetical protein IPP88_14600 [Betaproteobacteria bacterium]|nr:hypothetical protein [Betaproteobacteria bacterium]
MNDRISQRAVAVRRPFAAGGEVFGKNNESSCAPIRNRVKIALFAASAVASSAESLLQNALQIIAVRTARASAEAEVKRPGKKKFSNLLIVSSKGRLT